MQYKLTDERVTDNRDNNVKQLNDLFKKYVIND